MNSIQGVGLIDNTISARHEEFIENNEMMSQVDGQEEKKLIELQQRMIKLKEEIEQQEQKIEQIEREQKIEEERMLQQRQIQNNKGQNKKKRNKRNKKKRKIQRKTNQLRYYAEQSKLSERQIKEVQLKEQKEQIKQQVKNLIELQEKMHEQIKILQKEIERIKQEQEAKEKRLFEKQLKEKQLKEQQEREEQEKQRRLEEERKKKMEAEQQRLLELQLKEKQLKEQQEKEQKQQELEYIQWQNNNQQLQQTKTQEMEVDESEIFYLLPQEQNSQPQQQQQQQQSQQLQDKYFQALKKKQVTKVVINNNQPKQSLEFFKNPGTVDKKDKPILKYQFETQLNDLFLNLAESKQIINPLSLVINQNINADNPEVLFHVLSDQMRQQNKVLFKSLKSDEKLMCSFQGLFTADSQDSKCFSLQLQETKNLNYNTIATDQQKREEFLKKFKSSLSIDLKVPESQIQIVGLEQGSIKVIYEIINSAGDPEVDSAGAPIKKEFKTPVSTSTLDELKRQFPGCEPKLMIHEYFKQAALSADDFDPRYNMDWINYKFGNYDKNGRGPKGNTQPYFFPVGWKGYALKVAGKYDNGNDDWLMMNNNPEEWYVMFHGTHKQFCKDIVEKGLKQGGRQAYQSQKCMITDKLIGKGIYFSNHIEVSEGGYTSNTIIGEQSFKLAFQTRVRPDALRQCKKPSDISSDIAQYKIKNKSYDPSLNDMTLWDNDFFVVNKTEDIRPYRILLKVVE